MNHDESIAFAEIVSVLKGYCAEKKTGVMYIATDANQSAQLVLNDGDINYIYFFNKRGDEALRLIPEIEKGRVRFSESSAPELRCELPSTEEILRYLSAAAGLAVKRAASAYAGGMLNGEQKQALKEGLALFIGPMATIICEEYLEEEQDLAGAIEKLALEIPSDEHAGKFRSVMQKKFSL